MNTHHNQGPSAPALSWALLLLTCVPAFGVVAAIFWYFWGTELVSDGATYWACARDVWTRPVGPGLFKCTAHDHAYVGIGTLALLYKLGEGGTEILHYFNILTYLTCIISFARLAFRILPHARWFEVSLVTFVFALTPAIGVYSIALGLDLLLTMFTLLLINAVLAGRITLGVFFGALLVFGKESGTIFFAAAAPFMAWYVARSEGYSRAGFIRGFCLFIPGIIQAINIFSKGSLSENVTAYGYCASSSFEFLFNPHLLSPNIQNYLFDLFLFNFQWLLMIPIVIALFVPRGPLRSITRPKPEFIVLLGFLLAAFYSCSRCPVWNNIKYVIMGFPYPVLLSYACGIAICRFVSIRLVYFGIVATFFGLSALKSFDPLSYAFYGSTPFGNGPMYCMQSRVRTPEQGDDCGRDEMIYNLQRLEFSRPRPAMAP